MGWLDFGLVLANGWMSRPGLSARRNPSLKSETWATHSCLRFTVFKKRVHFCARRRVWGLFFAARPGHQFPDRVLGRFAVLENSSHLFSDWHFHRVQLGQPERG
jgi:hypothetical protein